MIIKDRIKQNKTIVYAIEETDRLRRLIFSRFYFLQRKCKQKDTDKKALEELKDIHKGERCFIVANGPSLLGEDLELIKDEVSFAVNGAYKTYNRTTWRPDYYVLTDDNLGEEVFIGALSDKSRLKMFFNSGVIDYSDDMNRVCYVVGDTCISYGADDRRIKRTQKTYCGSRISADISKKVYAGKTVIYSTIQIAMYMGFKNIYLLGLDCDFSSRNKHSELLDDYEERSERENARLRRAAKDMIDQFDGMAQLLPYYSVNVYNATRGGKLESFSRVKLEDVIGGKPSLTERV